MSNAFTDLMVARKIEKLQGELSATIGDKIATDSVPKWKANTAYTAG